RTANPTRNPNATANDPKNRYRGLQRRTAGAGPPARRREITEALARLAPELDELATPFESGRGRIMFAALGEDWKMLLDSQMPVTNRAVLDDSPFLHTLLELLVEGRPAGVVLVSGDGARLLEWRLGRMREVDTLEQEEQEAPHERAGQLGGGPSGQYHTPMREQRQAREREWGQRFLDQVPETVTN